MVIIAARLLLPALLLLLLWAPSSGPTQAGGGLVYPLYVYPSQATLSGIYTVSSRQPRSRSELWHTGPAVP